MRQTAISAAGVEDTNQMAAYESSDELGQLLWCAWARFGKKILQFGLVGAMLTHASPTAACGVEGPEGRVDA